MNGERYVELLADLLSRDPERMRAANRELYREVVDPPSANGATALGALPDLALVDAEQKVAAST